MVRDWSRILPDGDHRWQMGLRRGASPADFFADEDARGTVRAERCRWLTESPERYAALLPEAEPLLMETVELAQLWGQIPAGEVASTFATLLQLGGVWEPDFVWMLPGEGGQYRLMGGVLCFPSSWDLRSKLGRPMWAVHGPVPGLTDALSKPIDAFLSRLGPDEAWTRENWGLSRDAERNHHPARWRRVLDETVTVNEVWLRLEHQLLMRLPISGGALFGIRVENVPIAELLRCRTAIERLARLLETMSPSAAAYKEIAKARPALLRILRSALDEMPLSEPGA
jgi:hypothetical protein